MDSVIRGWALSFLILLLFQLPALSQTNCTPIPVATFQQNDQDAVVAYNTLEHNVFVLWNRIADINRFVTDSSERGRIVNANGILSTPQNFSFASPEGRAENLSASVAYNSNANEFLMTWFETPEVGLNHLDGLFKRIVDSTGHPKIPPTRITSQFTYLPQIVYNPTRNEYWIAYTAGLLEGVAFGRLTSNGDFIGTPVVFGGSKDFSVLKNIVRVEGTSKGIIFWTKTATLPITGIRRSTLMAQQISDSGQIIGTSYPCVHQGTFGIGNPVAVYNPLTQEFLALVQGKSSVANQTIEVQSVLLNSDAKAISTPHHVATINEISEPAVVYNPILNRFALFYFRDEALYFRELNSRGNPISSERLLSCTKRFRASPSLVFDSATNSYLAFWSHPNPKTRFDVYMKAIAPSH